MRSVVYRLGGAACALLCLCRVAPLPAQTTIDYHPPEVDDYDPEETSVGGPASAAVADTGRAVAPGNERWHNFALSVGGGLHSLLYSVDGTRGDARGGVRVSARYLFYPTGRVGLSLGATFATLQSRLTQTGLRSFAQETMVDYGGERLSVEPRLHFAGWRERQRVLTLQVPVGLAVRADMPRGWSFEGVAELAALFNVRARYECSGGAIEEELYVPSLDVLLRDLPEHGLNTFDGAPEGDVHLRRAMPAAGLDLRFLKGLSERLDLSIGLYCSVGLGSLAQSDVARQYDSGREVGRDCYVSALDCSSASSVRPLMAGLSVGVNVHEAGRPRPPRPVSYLGW